jgi:protein TorT
MAVDMMVRLLDGEQPGKDFPFRAGPIILTVTADNIDDFRYETFFGTRDFDPVFEVEAEHQP